MSSPFEHAVTIESVKCFRKLPEIEAVYAIVRDGQVQYIGQTQNLRKRFCSHRHKGLSIGGEIRWNSCDGKPTRLKAESDYIRHLQPPQNIDPPPSDPKYATVRFYVGTRDRLKFYQASEVLKGKAEPTFADVVQRAVDALDLQEAR